MDFHACCLTRANSILRMGNKQKRPKQIEHMLLHVISAAHTRPLGLLNTEIRYSSKRTEKERKKMCCAPAEWSNITNHWVNPVHIKPLSKYTISIVWLWIAAFTIRSDKKCITIRSKSAKWNFADRKKKSVSISSGHYPLLLSFLQISPIDRDV